MQPKTYQHKTGVFIARLQPIHNGHLSIIAKMLDECERVVICIGSSNKEGTIRNPFPHAKRLEWLEGAIHEFDFNRIVIMSLPDLNNENGDWDLTSWGRYLYYNIVSRIEAKSFTIYYGDNPDYIRQWFDNTEVVPFITVNTYDRDLSDVRISSTQIRERILQNDDTICQFLPGVVFDDFQYIKTTYEKILENPKEDFRLES